MKAYQSHPYIWSYMPGWSYGTSAIEYLCIWCCDDCTNVHGGTAYIIYKCWLFGSQVSKLWVLVGWWEDGALLDGALLDRLRRFVAHGLSTRLMLPPESYTQLIYVHISAYSIGLADKWRTIVSALMDLPGFLSSSWAPRHWAELHW